MEQFIGWKGDVYGFCGARDLAPARQLNPALQTFDQWLAANKGRTQVEAAAAGA
jgi:hypothetical protein